MPNTDDEQRVIQMIDNLVERAQKASKEYMKLNQEQVDEIVKKMSMAGLENHMKIAKMAVEETGRGIYEDKITKNMFATEYIYHSIKYDKTVGVINENVEEGYTEIAEPIGIIAGVTPVTNPTSTTMFKSIIAAKTRNVIIFGFHPSAQKSSTEAARILRDAAVSAGAPEDCILWIDEPSIQATNRLMNHPGVNLILATGGTGMVKAAYSCGKPALGVGPGNVPCYIDKTAKLETSVNDLVMSKSFDNGMICASEQAVIIDKEITKEKEYKRNRRIGRVYQNPAMGTCPSMTILENMALADNKGKLYGLGPGTNKTRIGYYREQLAQLGLGLEDKLDVKVGSLSGGQRQAMALLMSVMTPIEFLILDEHTAALDPKTAELIMELTDKIVRDKKLTAVMVTHNLRYAMEYGNRLIMMHEGRIVLDKKNEEKQKMQMDDILKLFNEISIECGN